MSSSLDLFPVIAFTGHRPDKLGGYNPKSPLNLRIKAVLRSKIQAIIEEDPNAYFISGMAIGIDQWAAEIVLELGGNLVCAIPFNGQEKTWPKESQDLYWDIMRQAKHIYNVSGANHYRKEYMHDRNKWMVNKCTKVVAVWNGEMSGGTYQCVKYAKSKNKEIDNLWDQINE